MARTIMMAPHAPHRMTAKPPPTPHPHGKPPPAAAHRPAPRRAHHGALAAVLAIALVLAGGGLWYWLGGRVATVDPGEQLQSQMEAAAKGEAVPTHAFGGALSVSSANGRTNIIAEGVPSRACVQVGWRLARAGTIIVNGVLPTRLSAARLSELCSGDAATLIWVPDE
ncbi:MAG TPA: hypothetical protein VK196_02520 [Magnetospirillum sp.]|nr:hypothetical protein [Magnetospirillum sp.]